MRGLRASIILAAVGALVGAAPPSTAPRPSTSAPVRAAVDAFFARPELGETRAILVLQDGVPVVERYAPGYGRDNRFISWSMAKSLTSTLVGQLVADGKLRLDAPAPVPEWHRRPGDPRAKITLRQLLHMSSGLNHTEGGERLQDADTIRILYTDRARDAAGASVAQRLEAAPGSRYEYSTATSVILADIVQRVVAPETRTPAERRQAMRAHMLDRLARPAGMASLVCEFDAAGTMLGGSLCHATARDWARFGQMYLDSGAANGRQVVPAEWVAFVRTPSATDGGYGGHFWLNRPRPKDRDPALFPEAGPPDAYAAVGHLGQYVVVVPSKRLVVVRLGKTQDQALTPVRRAIGRLVNAFPDRR